MEDDFLTRCISSCVFSKGWGGVLYWRPLLWQHQPLHQPPVWPEPHPSTRVHAAPGPEVPSHRLLQLQRHPQRTRAGVRHLHSPAWSLFLSLLPLYILPAAFFFKFFFFFSLTCSTFCSNLEYYFALNHLVLGVINNTWLALSVSLGLTMETAFGTLRASISPASVDRRNASTRPRPSPWSRADWLDWMLVQNQELTVGWPCWETLKTFTHGAFGLTSSVSHMHIGSGNTRWRFYPKNPICGAVFSTWNVLFLLKLATFWSLSFPLW